MYHFSGLRTVLPGMAESGLTTDFKSTHQVFDMFTGGVCFVLWCMYCLLCFESTWGFNSTDHLESGPRTTRSGTAEPGATADLRQTRAPAPILSGCNSIVPVASRNGRTCTWA